MRSRAKAAVALSMIHTLAPGALSIKPTPIRERDIVPKDLQDEKVKAAEAKRERKVKLLQGRIK